LSQVKNIVIVSDYIFSDACKFDSITEAYRRGLAMIDRELAKTSDLVLEACMGLFIAHKGNPEFVDWKVDEL
jgi:adenosylcobinamide kinase/adenosylcobinamide-phosphate guanylyltransferase